MRVRNILERLQQRQNRVSRGDAAGLWTGPIRVRETRRCIMRDNETRQRRSGRTAVLSRQTPLWHFWRRSEMLCILTAPDALARASLDALRPPGTDVRVAACATRDAPPRLPALRAMTGENVHPSARPSGARRGSCRRPLHFPVCDISFALPQASR